MTYNIRNTIFTEEELTKLNIIREYIKEDEENIKRTYIDQFPIFYLDENNEIKVNNSYNYNGLGVKYCNYISLDRSYINNEGYFKNSELHGENCIEYYLNGKTPKYVGSFENGEFIKGKWYKKNEILLKSGTFKLINKKYILNGKYCKDFYPITIKQGEFRNNSPYSISAFLREDPTGKTLKELNKEQINPDKKIYTLKINEENTNKRVITYYGKALGLDENIELQININENNIATFSIMQNGKAITNKEEIENIINKIKEFFINIPIEQLEYFDPNLSPLYYFIMYNKINNSKEHIDINVLIPDDYVYKYKTDKEVERTINSINQIPQEKRKGKYIIPCDWLKYAHQVNLIIDFDNKIFEIVNTGKYIDQDIINKLQIELRNNFKEENWIVYENHTVIQSTRNCVIASNIVATEKVMLEKQVEEYNEKLNKITDIDKVINNLQQQLNSIINGDENKITITVKESKRLVQCFLWKYNDNIEAIAINEILYQDLKNEIEELKKERQGQINEEELLNNLLRQKSIEDRIKNIKQDKKKLQKQKENFVRYNLVLVGKLFKLEECNKQFDKKISERIINNGMALRSVEI